MKIKLSFFTFLLISILGFSQQRSLTENAEVSVLTFGPGTSLNDAFGHNAFRIKDEDQSIDLVYGYGEYDFDAPNFYLKFARGKLNYMISRHRFRNIFYHYTNYNRTIDEQILNLTVEEKQRLFDFLENNYKPENRKYLYDFFYDNCATRIRDVSNIATNNKISYRSPKDFEQKTFRQLIHEHVNRNSWGSLGIDIALGSVIDRDANPYEYMFLPKYINAFFETAKIDSTKDLVKSSSNLYTSKPKKTSNLFLISPFIILGLLALGIIYLTYRDHKLNARSKWLDTLIFSITGVIGIFLLLLWFATDHTTTGYNYNLLWAFPLNLLLLFQLRKNIVKNWVKGFLKFLILMLCLMTMHWLIGVQIFAITLIPLLIAIAFRYIFLLKFLNKQ
ncbi:lipoprotein N-acyltransferase Lnb domain-containing protein [Winogradskyella tangerina]|uniref:lipoprotein N-acyltransferase Lnb domain-containing protein n=1 Tax=Winogradskyella tangerina TaxID=2023240 RepID=UPI000DBE0DC7|nr:DUF4105 domain-containing protein [Winogradskyella tangerina]